MPKVTFIVDHTPDGQAPNRPHYKAGETYDLERSYAEKYVRRGWAKPFDAKVERERKDREAAERKAQEAAQQVKTDGLSFGVDKSKITDEEKLRARGQV